MSAERFPQIFARLQRGPQIVGLKDAALIAAYTGVGPGDVVVDAGAGAGWLAAYLGHLVGPTGRVVSYEIKPEFMQLADENIKRAGLEKIVQIKKADIYEGIDEKDVDVVTLDLPEPQRTVGHAFAALKRGGYLATYLPNIEQVKTLAEAAKEAGFVDIATYESLQREWLVRPQGCRPATTGIMHTAWLTFGRKP